MLFKPDASGVDPETVAGSTAALSASGRASGNLDTRSLSNATMEIRALDGQMRGSPSRSFSPRLQLEEPACPRAGAAQTEGLQLRSRIVGSTRDTPAEGIAVNLDGRVEDVSVSAASVPRPIERRRSAV